MNYSTIIGIDVSKNHLDTCLLKGEKSCHKRYENSLAGIARIVKLAAGNNALIVFEPTAGYENVLQKALQKAEIEFVKPNPVKTRSFANAGEFPAKTDKIDAKMLAFYGQIMQPKRRVSISDEQADLRAKMGRREQLVEMIREEKCRLEKACDQVLAEIAEHLSYLERRLKEKDQEISSFIDSNPLLKAKKEALCGMKGVGQATQHSLLAHVSELGCVGPKQVALLVGLAPIVRESGASKNDAHIEKGRKSPRNALYMAAVTAIRCEPVIRDFFLRLRAKGKKFKVAITACMRKIIVILNQRVKEKLRSFYLDTQHG
jgi:transposase